MNKVLVGLIVIILIGGIFGFIYWKFEANKEEPVEYGNLTISAEYNNRKIITGYIIETEDGILEGNTSLSYQLLKIKKNQTITIYNKNLENQRYFINKKTIDFKDEIKRIDLDLIQSEEIKVQTISTRPIILELSSKSAKDIIFCLDWSLSYIFVKTNYTRIDNPKGYEDWGDCYELGTDLIDDKHNLRIEYTQFSTPKQTDFIKMVLLQKDLLGNYEKIVNIK